MAGGPAYLSIRGKESDAYALFDCIDWKHMSNEQQLVTLTLNLKVAAMVIPYKDWNTDEEA